jgi:hypothetical protein
VTTTFARRMVGTVLTFSSAGFRKPILPCG